MVGAAGFEPGTSCSQRGALNADCATTPDMDVRRSIAHGSASCTKAELPDEGRRIHARLLKKRRKMARADCARGHFRPGAGTKTGDSALVTHRTGQRKLRGG